MSEQSFEQMLEESLKGISNGEVVEGTILEVRPDEILVNVGVKYDGIITKSEFTLDDNVNLSDLVKAGDTIEAKVLRVNEKDGQVVLSHRALAIEKGNKRLKEAFENKEVLVGKVVQVRDGGLNVVCNESRVFIPASLVSDVFERDLSKYADQDLEFVIIEFNPQKRRIIGNRKMIIKEKRQKEQQEAISRLNEGDKVEGTVKNITDFGVFIDLGGIDGLLHISEMSWGKVENPKKKFKSGDKLLVQIKEMNNDKIALSLKFAEDNPWLNIENKFKVGDVVKGKVARMTDFGAFIELEDGIDALLHVSQISHDRVSKPSDVLKNGEEIEAKVLDVNTADKKISLSIKALTSKPEATNVKEEKDEEIHEYIDKEDVKSTIDVSNIQ